MDGETRLRIDRRGTHRERGPGDRDYYRLEAPGVKTHFSSRICVPRASGYT